MVTIGVLSKSGGVSAISQVIDARVADMVKGFAERPSTRETDPPYSHPNPWPYDDSKDISLYSCDGVVHCECALISYLGSPKSPGVSDAPICNYLGVSKLSCGACHEWVRAFNVAGGQAMNYCTAGTHGKWYFPWAIPPKFSSDAMKVAMANNAGEQFKRYSNPANASLRRQEWSGSTDPKRMVRSGLRGTEDITSKR